MALASGGKGYLIDTCTLIRWMPMMLGTGPEHAGVRKWIWAAFQRGLFKIPEAVADEVLAHSIRLSDELEKRGVEVIIPDGAITSEVAATRKRFEAEGRSVGRHCVNDNDLQLILIAEDEDMTVITEETPREGRCNIPAACEHLDVPYMGSAKHGF